MISGELYLPLFTRLGLLQLFVTYIDWLFYKHNINFSFNTSHADFPTYTLYTECILWFAVIF